MISDGCAVMVSQLLGTPVQHGFVTVVRSGGRLAVIRNQQTGNAAEIAEGMNMAQQPVFRFHVAADLGAGVPAAGQNDHEDAAWRTARLSPCP